MSLPKTSTNETFDRKYVQKLRDEAAGHRVKAKRVDALNARLVTARAALTGRLADPTDLAFTDDLLDDDGLVDEAKVQAASTTSSSASRTSRPGVRVVIS